MGSGRPRARLVARPAAPTGALDATQSSLRSRSAQNQPRSGEGPAVSIKGSGRGCSRLSLTRRRLEIAQVASRGERRRPLAESSEFPVDTARIGLVCRGSCAGGRQAPAFSLQNVYGK